MWCIANNYFLNSVYNYNQQRHSPTAHLERLLSFSVEAGGKETAETGHRPSQKAPRDSEKGS